jgi:choice-of-anchor B domain-containing protein
VGLLPAHTNVAIGGLWKDVKVYDNHAFIVSESVGHGMQVFDLRQLRVATRDPVTFEETAHYAGVSRTHNFNINTDTGYAYLVSGETCSRGLHMVDVSNPTEPAFAGCFTEHGNIHDTQCVIYEGPDTDYQGREICFNSAPQVTVFGARRCLQHAVDRRRDRQGEPPRRSRTSSTPRAASATRGG